MSSFHHDPLLITPPVAPTTNYPYCLISTVLPPPALPIALPSETGGGEDLHGRSLSPKPRPTLSATEEEEEKEQSWREEGKWSYIGHLG